MTYETPEVDESTHRIANILAEILKCLDDEDGRSDAAFLDECAMRAMEASGSGGGRWTVAEPKTARQVFEIGQRVEMTQHAIDQFLSPPRTGTVVGFSRTFATSVLVVKDGQKTPASYSMRFWQPLTTP